jgi:hypothetical protein
MSCPLRMNALLAPFPDHLQRSRIPLCSPRKTSLISELVVFNSVGCPKGYYLNFFSGLLYDPPAPACAMMVGCIRIVGIGIKGAQGAREGVKHKTELAPQNLGFPDTDTKPSEIEFKTGAKRCLESCGSFVTVLSSVGFGTWQARGSDLAGTKRGATRCADSLFGLGGPHVSAPHRF